MCLSIDLDVANNLVLMKGLRCDDNIIAAWFRVMIPSLLVSFTVPFSISQYHCSMSRRSSHTNTKPRVTNQDDETLHKTIQQTNSEANNLLEDKINVNLSLCLTKNHTMKT
jgi:hypothetical protein